MGRCRAACACAIEPQFPLHQIINGFLKMERCKNSPIHDMNDQARRASRNALWKPENPTNESLGHRQNHTSINSQPGLGDRLLLLLKGSYFDFQDVGFFLSGSTCYIGHTQDAQPKNCGPTTGVAFSVDNMPTVWILHGLVTRIISG